MAIFMTNKNSTDTYSSRLIIIRHFLLSISLVLLFTLIISCASLFVAHADTFMSQSYLTVNKLPLNSIVSLQTNSTDEVVAATNNNADNILGIVVNASNSSLSLSNDHGNQVSVATSGTLRILVSDINGPILQGDHITASPLSGVGMKATSNVRVVGIAQADLSSKNGTQQSYTDSTGHKQSVLLGEVPALVNVSYYYKEPDKTLIPSAIQNIANALAGKSVSVTPILISAGIFIVTLIAVVSIIYAMIRSSIISVGRNPLSQKAIYRGAIQLTGLVILILTGAFVAIYLVLTRL